LLTQWREVKTNVEELPESRVRLEVEVPEEDVRHALEHAASDLAQEIRIPGFRKGKVPTRVVAARVGRDALWEEAVRSHVEGWFWAAASTSGIRPVASPELELGDGAPADGGSFRFSATVSVVPTPELPDWTTLEVGAPEAEVPAEDVDAELDRIRETAAELTPADRPVQPGDVVVLDLVGEEVGVQRDYVVELGEGRLLDDVEAALPGMAAGETKQVEFALAEDRQATVEVSVKEVNEKVLPPLDDDLAKAATEFDTLEELRTDVEGELREQLEEALEANFREEAIDALVEATRFDSLEPLVERRTADLAAGLARSLESRGIPLDAFLTMTGQTQEQLVERLRGEAEQAVKRELVLEAVADRAGIEVSEGDVEALVREEAEQAQEEAEPVLASLRDGRGFERLREDLRLRRALDELVSGVKRIPVDLARAREKLWTPEKEKVGGKMNIWTPGSEEQQ
jgi:trigger factor